MIATETNFGNFAKALNLAMKVSILGINHEFSVTSWYRTEKRNNDVGGLIKSLHLEGLAIDVVLDDQDVLQAFIQSAQEIGIYIYNEGDHLHLYERVHV